MMQKHSITIRGHRTSFSLEEPFWQHLKRIAKTREQSISRLVTQIDAKRGEDENLSSALRVFVLNVVSAEPAPDV